MKYNNSSGCIDSKVKNYHFICKDIDRIYLKVNFKQRGVPSLVIDDRIERV